MEMLRWFNTSTENYWKCSENEAKNVGGGAKSTFLIRLLPSLAFLGGQFLNLSKKLWHRKYNPLEVFECWRQSWRGGERGCWGVNKKGAEEAPGWHSQVDLPAAESAMQGWGLKEKVALNQNLLFSTASNELASLQSIWLAWQWIFLRLSKTSTENKSSPTKPSMELALHRNSYFLIYCIAGAVLTQDVMYTRFNFLREMTCVPLFDRK